MKILLTTLHAKYAHASLALPSIAAACQNIPDLEIVIRELTINELHDQQLRQIVLEYADVVGFSCYIWNIERTLRLVSDLKKISPQTKIVLGGPEVSFAVFELMREHPAIDYVLKGEGELPFVKLVHALTSENCDIAEIENLFYRDGDDIVAGSLVRGASDLDQLPSPFAAGLVNFDKPLTYYETSRGCPFSCAFCLSSTEGGVRSYSMERIKSDLLLLMEQPASKIKFVDRTFNYDSRRADQIWSFILENNRSSCFHFEIAADLLTESNMEILKKVPSDTFRFEIGIQSSFSETLKQVHRHADLDKIYAAIKRLRIETEVELHLDLVAGLPGETYPMFLQSLQSVLELSPHQIQVEPLKILKGAPMRKIAIEKNYSWSEYPPYTILNTPWLSYNDIGKIEIVGRLLDLFYNSGRITNTLKFLAEGRNLASLFDKMGEGANLQNLHSLSTMRMFETFYSLVNPLLSESQKFVFDDLLTYDYCHAEMPRFGKLPIFMLERGGGDRWPNRKELPQELEIPANSRITCYETTFSFDVSRGAALKTTITFVYCSSTGGGQKVILCRRN